jgi:ribosome assembly protein YihI (activator of Der GTPase)
MQKSNSSRARECNDKVNESELEYLNQQVEPEEILNPYENRKLLVEHAQYFVNDCNNRSDSKTDGC